MRHDEILKEDWREHRKLSSEEWMERANSPGHFKVRQTNEFEYYVYDRLAIRNDVVAGPFEYDDQAWAVADEHDKEHGRKYAEWLKAGNKGMEPGAVKLAAYDEQLDEMPGRSRSSMEKFFNSRHPKEVLKYFGNLRHGGTIKDGYEAYVPFDDEWRRVDSISVGSGKDRYYQMAGSGGWGGRQDWVTTDLGDVKIYKITREQVL